MILWKSWNLPPSRWSLKSWILPSNWISTVRRAETNHVDKIVIRDSTFGRFFLPLEIEGKPARNTYYVLPVRPILPACLASSLSRSWPSFLAMVVFYYIFIYIYICIYIYIHDIYIRNTYISLHTCTDIMCKLHIYILTFDIHIYVYIYISIVYTYTNYIDIHYITICYFVIFVFRFVVFLDWVQCLLLRRALFTPQWPSWPRLLPMIVYKQKDFWKI